MSPLRQPSQQGLLKTGQTTAYAAGDDGDVQAGIAKLYSIFTAGQFSGTEEVYVPTLARADIAFVNATSKITAATGLGVVKTGDVIRIRGSAGNDTEYTVATGNVSNEIVLTSAPVEEAAGAMITIAKQALQSNNCVTDLETGLMWMRYGSYSPAKLGAASDGKLLWTATAVEVHVKGNDLQMIAGGVGSCTVKIVGGAGEVLRYWAGYTYSFDGFANAVNKLTGFKCVSVTVNGADLDLVMDTGNLTAIAEAAGVNGSIYLSCNDIWSFANSANQAEVGGYSDWRVCNKSEANSILDSEAPTGVPDTTAFPGVTSLLWSSTTSPSTTTSALYFDSAYGGLVHNAKTSAWCTMLVRGGN